MSYIPLQRRGFYYYYRIEEVRFIIGVNVEGSGTGPRIWTKAPRGATFPMVGWFQNGFSG